MPPLTDAVAENRTAHLFGAYGSDGAVVLVELQARLLEGQAAMIQQAAHDRLGIFDKIFIDDKMNAPRQSDAEVIHQIDVVVIVTAKIAEIVGEGLALREMLLERGKACAEGMAARVDDFCIRQNEMGEADMQKIVRHLVDEERPTELAVHTRPVEEQAPEVCQVRLIKGRDAGGILIAVARHPSK